MRGWWRRRRMARVRAALVAHAEPWWRVDVHYDDLARIVVDAL